MTIAFNTRSGCVFLANSEFEVVMMNGVTLEEWFNCLECGHEGFKEDMKHGEDSAECIDYLSEIGVDWI